MIARSGLRNKVRFVAGDARTGRDLHLCERFVLSRTPDL